MGAPPPILDYAEFVDDAVEEFGLRSVPTRPLNLAPRGTCPFCGLEAALVHDTGNPAQMPDMVEGFHSPRTRTWVARAWLCSCGWWETETIQRDTMDFWNSTVFRVAQASLRRFDVASSAVPLSALRSHLRRNPESINEVDPRKFEHLAQSVFGDYYSCEVRHCGRSHDGGVDLILVDADRPVAIQVKRRADPATVEGVSLVREFLGACLLSDHSAGVLVTTARDFSLPAKNAARGAIERDLVTSFELVNRDEFLRRLSLVVPVEPGHWRRQVDEKLGRREGL